MNKPTLRGVAPPSGIYPVFRHNRLYVGSSLRGEQAWFGLMSDHELRSCEPELEYQWYNVYITSTGPVVVAGGMMGVHTVHNALIDPEREDFREMGLQARMEEALYVLKKINKGRYEFREEEGAELKRMEKPFLPPESEYRTGNNGKKRKRTGDAREEDLEHGGKCRKEMPGNEEDCDTIVVAGSQQLGVDQDDEEVLPQDVKKEATGEPAATMTMQDEPEDADAPETNEASSPSGSGLGTTISTVRTLAQLKENFVGFCHRYGEFLGSKYLDDLCAACGKIYMQTDATVVVNACHTATKIIGQYRNELGAVQVRHKGVRDRIMHMGSTAAIAEQVDGLSAMLDNQWVGVAEDLQLARLWIEEFEEAKENVEETSEALSHRFSGMGVGRQS